MALAATTSFRTSVLGRSRLRRLPSVFTSVSVFIVGAIVILAIFGSLIEPHDPGAQDLFHTSAGPSSQHWLGTDGLGRDIVSRMIAGAGAAITGPLVVALTGLLAASVLGILSGYMGGVIDMVIQRFVDFMFALPGLLIAIVIVAVVGGGYWLAVMVLSVLNFSGDIRILRGAALEQRALPYVEAARTLGRAALARSCTATSGGTSRRSSSPNARARLRRSRSSHCRASPSSGSGHRQVQAEWGRMLAENQSAALPEPGRRSGAGACDRAFRDCGDLIGDWVYDRYSSSGGAGR